MQKDKLIIICAAVLIVQLCLLIRNRRKVHRRWWVRPINRHRNVHGFHLTLFREMKNTDHEEFYVYTRMFPHSFNRLLNLVRPILFKKVLRGRRLPLHPELKLALTLSYVYLVLDLYFCLCILHCSYLIITF